MLRFLEHLFWASGRQLGDYGQERSRTLPVRLRWFYPSDPPPL